MQNSNSKLTKELIQEALRLVAAGIITTDAGLARNFSLNRSTISKWKARYPEFRKALDQAKEASKDPAIKTQIINQLVVETIAEEEAYRKRKNEHIKG